MRADQEVRPRERWRAVRRSREGKEGSQWLERGGWGEEIEKGNELG